MVMTSTRGRGFTLLEIMVVILIIGILLAIAVPQFINSRTRSQQRACISHLRSLESAKELFTYRNALKQGDTIDANLAWSDYSRQPYPICPAGGTYSIGLVGELPTCSLNASTPPHEIGN